MEVTYLGSLPFNYPFSFFNANNSLRKQGLGGP